MTSNLPSDPSALSMSNRKTSGKAIREVIAALGVIASLAFVGWEIQQNTAATRGQTRQALAQQSQNWLLLRSTNAEFDDIFHRAWESQEELTEAEARRSRIMMRWNLRRLENVYLQYLEGLVERSALGAYGFEAGELWFESDAFREFWARARSGYHPKFVIFLEGEYKLER